MTYKPNEPRNHDRLALCISLSLLTPRGTHTEPRSEFSWRVLVCGLLICLAPDQPPLHPQQVIH